MLPAPADRIKAYGNRYFRQHGHPPAPLLICETLGMTYNEVNRILQTLRYHGEWPKPERKTVEARS